MRIELLSKRELIKILSRHTYRCVSKHTNFVVGEDYFAIVDNGQTHLADEHGEVLWTFEGEHWKPYLRKTKMGKYVFVVEQNVDLDEGRGPYVVKAVVANEFDALTIADTLEPYHHRGQFTKVTQMLLLTNAEQYIVEQQKLLREKALAKLTKDERKVLGL